MEYIVLQYSNTAMNETKFATDTEAFNYIGNIITNSSHFVEIGVETSSFIENRIETIRQIIYHVYECEPDDE